VAGDGTGNGHGLASLLVNACVGVGEPEGQQRIVLQGLHPSVPQTAGKSSRHGRARARRTAPTSPYTFCMSETTIRVDSRVRDQLRALAEEDHTTLGSLLGCLAEREQYQREMRRANETMERMAREDPDAWRDYRDELNAFEEGTGTDGLGDATTEWPEYNEAARRAAARPR
jgi:hypothetical protein